MLDGMSADPAFSVSHHTKKGKWRKCPKMNDYKQLCIVKKKGNDGLRNYAYGFATSFTESVIKMMNGCKLLVDVFNIQLKKSVCEILFVCLFVCIEGPCKSGSWLGRPIRTNSLRSFSFLSKLTVGLNKSFFYYLTYLVLQATLVKKRSFMSEILFS